MLLISWCGKSENKPDIKLSFNESYEIFTKNLYTPEYNLKDVINTNVVKENLNIKIYGNEDFKKTHLELSSIWDTDIKNANSQSNVNIDISLFDDITNDTTILSGSFDLNKFDNEDFIKVNNFYLNKWEGNSDAKFVNLLIGNFLSKRIKLDTKNKIWDFKKSTQSIINFYQLPGNVVSFLQNKNIFKDLWKTTYDWYNAYKLWLNLDELSVFLKEINPDFLLWTGLQNNLTFDWMLVLQDKNNVVLEIKELKINQNNLLKWEIWNNRWNIVRQDLLNNKRYTINFKNMWKEIKLDVWIWDDIKSSQNVALISLLIKPEIKEKTINFLLNWSITINALNLWIQSSLQDIQLNVYGNYSMQELQKYSFTKPDNFLLLNQIIWDQFGVQWLIQETNQEFLSGGNK